MAEASHVTYELILSSDSGVPTEVPRPLKDFYDKVYVARWTYSTVFTLLCVSGFISNLIIIVVFCVSKTFRLPQNLFFFSLSLADLIWTVIGSTVVVNYHLGRQAYGEIVCRSIPVVNQSVCFVNMNCHIQIALVRYICIQHPDKKAKFFRWKTLVPTCILIWITTPLILSLLSCTGHLQVEYKPVTRVCQIDYGTSYYIPLICVVTTIFVVTVVCAVYIQIFVVFRRSKNKVSDHSSNKDKRQKQKQKEEFRLVLPMLSIFLAFCSTWFPYIAIDLYLDEDETGYPWVHVFTAHLVMLNPVFDPIIFIASSRNFREEFLRIFFRKS